MGIMKTDGQIQKDVLDEPAWDTRVKATDVGVEVDKGVVTLTGKVPSYGKNVAGREAAHRVADVLDVVDDVEVHIPSTYERSDTEIAQVLRNAFIWHVLVPEERIRTTVANGWVTLEGDVDTWSQQIEVEGLARDLFGVRGVTNLLVVNAPKVASEDLRDAIQLALDRRAEREAERITIDVRDGRVTLTGRVQSWAERQAILGTVAYAAGVRQVEDHLQVGMLG